MFDKILSSSLKPVTTWLKNSTSDVWQGFELAFVAISYFHKSVDCFLLNLADIFHHISSITVLCTVKSTWWKHPKTKNLNMTLKTANLKRHFFFLKKRNVPSDIWMLNLTRLGVGCDTGVFLWLFYKIPVNSRTSILLLLRT